MGVWVEIHCDTPDEWRYVRATGEPELSLDPRCQSGAGNQPGVMAMTPATAHREAVAKARAQGWRRVRGMGWACPHCLRVMADRQRMEPT